MILKTCAAIALRCRGIWAYLSRREERRQAVETHHEDRLRAIELEHARNAGTTSIIEALSDGGHVIEVEPGGRSRMVWMPERHSPPVIHKATVERDDEPGLTNPVNRGKLTP